MHTLSAFTFSSELHRNETPHLETARSFPKESLQPTTSPFHFVPSNTMPASNLRVFSKNPELAIRYLNEFAHEVATIRNSGALGFPVNQNTELEEFYRWYVGSELHNVSLNNAGNPWKRTLYDLNTHQFETELVSYFAPLFGFEQGCAWGMVTQSGTDGNLHGMYYGVQRCVMKTGQRPVVYVSKEAHYSVKLLAHLQNLELKVINASVMGQMDTSDLERQLDPKRPALIVVAIGTTFKGAIDDQRSIDEVLARKKPICAVRHLDAALFGGYLPFCDEPARLIIDRRKIPFDSVCISGHKFFGCDEPLGLLLTSKEEVNQSNAFMVTYLGDAVPTISCSRSGLAVLKLWWKIARNPPEKLQSQAKQILENAAYFHKRLEESGCSSWLNALSNTVFFTRPPEELVHKYNLSLEEDATLGNLAHIVVMPHVTREVLDRFLEDLIPAIKAKDSTT